MPPRALLRITAARDGQLRLDAIEEPGSEPVTRVWPGLHAERASLPVDPLSDVPAGYDASQRGQPGGFSADPDVMDTWMTSSLSPEIISGWPDDRERHAPPHTA